MRGWLGVLSIVALVVAMLAPANAAPQESPSSPTRSASEIYAAACATCHGEDGRGSPRTTVGFETPLPDFTDCAFTTAEPDVDWSATIHKGGPVRGFNRLMPAFGEALSELEIALAIGHARRFCSDTGWPRGDLNFPRPLVAEKAFPENEALLTTAVSRTAGTSASTTLIYERRIGRRTQYEIAAPIEYQRAEAAVAGVGDLALAVKHVFAHSLGRGHILSGGAELVLPTGSSSRGLGGGVTMLEPFVAFGQRAGGGGFVQLHGGAGLSTDRAKAPHEAFLRVAAGRTLRASRFGRMWSPMIELLAARELVGGEPVLWDAVPQMQVTLSRRQHVRVSAGYRIPVTHRLDRPRSFLAYFLWDWFDGGLLTGW